MSASDVLGIILPITQGSVLHTQRFSKFVKDGVGV